MAAAIPLLASGAPSAQGQDLPLPPGTILTGEVFKPLTFSCPPPSVPSLTNGADANSYVCLTVTPPFVGTAPAYMVVTSEPTQYVRVYPTVAPPTVRSWRTPARYAG